MLMLCHRATKAATHWVVTEDGKIHTQDDSVFTLRRPYDLVSLLEQEKRAEKLKTIKSQLIDQKRNIEASSTQGTPSVTLDGTLVDDLDTNTILIDGDTDMEQVVYATSEDCNKAGKALPEFDLYVGTVLFLPPKAASTNDDLGLDNVNELLKYDERLR